MQNEKLNLSILLLVSVLLSTYLFLRTYVISIDGAIQYIPIAKDFVLGFFRKALSHNQQPLYSFIIAFVSQWVSDFEVAGKLVSSFFGVLIILPVYFLGKRIFDQKIAFFSALFLTIHPYIRRFSADVLKESTYLFFLATTIWFSWRTIQSEKRYPYLFIPLFSVIAYLVRPDGVEALSAVFFYVIFIKQFNVAGKRSTAILLLLLSSAILFLPYLIHLRESTGTWTLSRAKGITEFLGLAVASSEVSLIYRVLFSFKELNFEIFARFHPLYVLLLAIGLFKKASSHFKDGDKFLISFFVLHYVVLFLLILNFTDWSGDGKAAAYIFSSRFVLPLLLFSIYWVGDGFLVIYYWIYTRFESHRLLLRLKSNRKPKFIWVTLLILILAIILPKTLKPQRYERLPEKWAGIWIKNQSGKGMNIFTTIHRVAYYAEGNLEYIDLKKDTIDKIKTSMVANKAQYLVIGGEEMIEYPEIVNPIKTNFIEVMRYEGKGMETVFVYKRIQ
jgi:hypothetical protein